MQNAQNSALPATIQRLLTCSEHPGGGMIQIMSIYATLWKLKFPKDGDDFTGCDWVEVTAQGVPAHIGSPSPGAGYESVDPFGAFLPPPVAVDSDGDAPAHASGGFHHRAYPKRN